MSDDPLKLLLERLDRIVESNDETRKAIEASNEETREAVSDEIAKQGQAFADMQGHHAETLKAAKAAPAWAVLRGILYVTGGLAVLVFLAVLILQASGQVHVAIGPAAGFCATPPVEQPNGGLACWETPPADEEAAKRLQVCLEAPWSINYGDRTHPHHGRMACWAEPPRTPKPAPERDG